MRVRPFAVRVALGSDGTPQVKALLDGETPLYEEPLYQTAGGPSLPSGQKRPDSPPNSL